MFGGTWAGYIMAAFVVISGFGALVGWTMICAEMPLAASKDGLFPERFKRMSKNGVPIFGIVISTVLASIAMLINYLGAGGATAFTTLVLMSGITAAIPYAFSALAQIKWRLIDHRTVETPRFVRDMVVAIVALIFSILFIYYSRNTSGHRLLGHGSEGGELDWKAWWTYWSPFILCGVALLLGIPVYRSQRKRMTKPEQVPPYR